MIAPLAYVAGVALIIAGCFMIWGWPIALIFGGIITIAVTAINS